METEGKIMQVMPVQTIATQKGNLKKLEFILEIESKYPKKVCFSLWNDKADIFSSKPGDTVKVTFDLESREYNGRWYTEAKAWKVDNVSSSSSDASQIPAENNDEPLGTFTSKNEDLDDLPF